MFEQLEAAPADKILALVSLFREDPREQKIDLGVGVYKDESGQTPVLASVRAAEQRVFQAQTSKSYLGMAGDRGFNAAMAELVFGEALDTERVRALQTPGGTGALRLLCDLMQRARPGARLWVSDPTWPNHLPLAQAAGLRVHAYPYFDPASGGVRFEQMMAALAECGADDIVLLHGCCHNPTGANLDLEQWAAVAAAAAAQGFFPFIDFAYHGFGDGLVEDAAPLRLLIGAVPELVVASSCSKNFGIYRERTGAAMIVAEGAARADAVFSQLTSIARGNYSMPPDHGAAVVRTILEDPTLRGEWEGELDAMRARMLGLRRRLAGAMAARCGEDRFDFVARHRGMFSRMPLRAEQVQQLREQHGVYLVDDGRFNVAGLRESQIDAFADALVAVGI